MMPGCEIVEQNVGKEHLHLVMVIPPRNAVSDVVGGDKGGNEQAPEEKV